MILKNIDDFKEGYYIATRTGEASFKEPLVVLTEVFKNYRGFHCIDLYIIEGVEEEKLEDWVITAGIFKQYTFQRIEKTEYPEYFL